jgi:hypothetical protein
MLALDINGADQSFILGNLTRVYMFAKAVYTVLPLQQVLVISICNKIGHYCTKYHSNFAVFCSLQENLTEQ